jgi:hypothetical protein
MSQNNPHTMSDMMTRPQPDEHAPYYGKYVSLVPEQDILSVLESQLDETVEMLGSIPESQAVVLHPPYTWTIKQVVGHVTDGDRIFGYRALRIARGDTTPLPGFDENEYARAPEFNVLPLASLVSEFESVRRSVISLFQNLTNESWARRGEANGNPVSVRALAFIIAGHTRHHMTIVRKRLAGN